MDDEYTVYAVKFQLGGRACESEHGFLTPDARDGFLALLEEIEQVGEIRTYAYCDPEYVEERREEAEAWDHAVVHP